MRLLVLLIIAGFNATAQVADKPWKAVWITHPSEVDQYEVLKFRKSFDLASKPASFVINVSADNRYKLFVNGTLVSLGPARGDMFHWNYETVDIAQHLTAGRNTLAALVWNEGPQRPEAQVSLMTAFILQGNAAAENVVNTDKTWKVIRDEGYQPLRPRAIGYYVAGQGEFITMGKTVKGFEVKDVDDSQWSEPRTMYQGIPKGVFTFAPVQWMLVPSPLPQMEMTPQRMASVRKAEGVKVPTGFPKTKVQLTIPANTSATLLIDNEVLTNAYTTMVFSDGKDAGISIGYAEALYVRNKNEDLNKYSIERMPKDHRDEVDGKVFVGRRDSLISDGSKSQSFTSLTYRTYRYVQLKVKTAAQPLIIDDLYGVFTGYPFQLASSFTTNDVALKKTLEIGWRTARLCATETYMDCPYYEQLQYFGDTRIQALVTMFNSRDDRLVRNAIAMGDRSRIAEGVTMSRYPTATTQLIPPFSLWWIGMVHDYWMYRDDPAFVKSMLPGTRAVLSFFQKYQQPDGSLKGLPYWIFTDWVTSPGWKDGMAPIGRNGNSAILDMQLMWTYQLAAQLEEKLGLKELSIDYLLKADQLKTTVRGKYWDATSGLFADTQEKDVFSQHANALAVLCGLVDSDDRGFYAKMVLPAASSPMARASIYFKYYFNQAIAKLGFGYNYLSLLDPWHNNINMGLTTWSETSDVANARSDCHAWGSSPNVELYRIVLGIESAEPGFGKVRIKPMGVDPVMGGKIPHPQGEISVLYTKDSKGKWTLNAELPGTVTGELIWGTKSYPLKSGKNTIDAN